MSYEALRSLRPTNVMHQLGVDAAAVLLNGRQVLGALTELPGVLWMPTVAHLEVVPAVLRAAAHLRAVVGFTLAPESTDDAQLKRAHAPGRLFHAAVEAAEKIPGCPPFVLHVQEPPVSSATGPELEAVRRHLFACLESGYTSFGVDLSACAVDTCAAVATALLEPVLEMELGVAVGLPRSGAESALVALKQAGIEIDLVLLPGPQSNGEAAWKLARDTAPLVAPGAVGWPDVRESGQRLPGVDQLENAFVRAVIGGRRLAGLSSKPEHLEALAYVEADGVLQRLGGKGTAPEVARLLQP